MKIKLDNMHEFFLRKRERERDECNLSEGFALKNAAVELVLHCERVSQKDIEK